MLKICDGLIIEITAEFVITVTAGSVVDKLTLTEFAFPEPTF